MPVEVAAAEGGGRRGRSVLVGIGIDGQSRELLDWALVKVADPGDHVVAIHVSRDLDSKKKPLLDGYLEVYEGLCTVKKVDLTGHVSKGSSIRKVLVREAKNRGAAAVVVGVYRENPLRTWTSVAKYCAKRLPPTTDVLAIHNGKIVFRRSSNNQPPGHEGDPRPSFVLSRNPALTDTRTEFGDSETSEIARHSLENFSALRKDKALSTSSFSFASEDFGEQRPGWPLLSTVSPLAEEASKMSVVKWVMRLPNRSPPQSPLSKEGGFSPMTPIETGSPFSPQSNCTTDTSELLENLEKLFLKNSSGCKWFSYDVMKTSTSEFSSDKLIGKGGCNCVYKGILPDGKPVAVKVLKSSKESSKDFTREVDVMTSLSHKNITPLIGLCVEDNALISVYDLLPKGNLEENLHGNSKEKSVLSWEVRCKVAVGIAEALNYLHNECSPPVIHRDVKSSNILLSDEFEPQLSDFGLAIWGPSDSSFLTDNDVVGTFGYLAPEYFMYGKVSDKIDVYSFGVVLLELLSGRKPISSESTKGQESLVMWAKPKLESGDLRSILDPNLDGNIDEVEIQRMALAVRFCLIRSARLRPKMRQILNILKGDKDVEEFVKSQFGDRRGTENEETTDDEVYPHSSAESHLTLALLDMEDTSPSFSSGEQSSGTSSEEYLKERWSRSSSLD
ncbi:protein kinase STUNTED [Rhododendron vialii]|uniref:protein kinase STUNTED n=1 Tax=Rhododendron vialii TaxID=182163 RepID=UPI002660388A|nr:protein kinase STUNTED [Rhododendron vialii]XP_058215896.1 protein kinase STUNTED [Rhododendron vialii]